MCSDLFRLALGTDWFHPADAASTVANKTLLCACKGDIYHVLCTSEWIYTIKTVNFKCDTTLSSLSLNPEKTPPEQKKVSPQMQSAS